MRIERSAPKQFIYNSSSGGFIATIGNCNKRNEMNTTTKNWMSKKKSANHWHTHTNSDFIRYSSHSWIDILSPQRKNFIAFKSIENHCVRIVCVCVFVCERLANAAEKWIPAINHVHNTTINKAVCLAIRFFFFFHSPRSFVCGELFQWTTQTVTDTKCGFLFSGFESLYVWISHTNL